jgi:hypothetical protein
MRLLATKIQLSAGSLSVELRPYEALGHGPHLRGQRINQSSVMTQPCGGRARSGDEGTGSRSSMASPARGPIRFCEGVFRETAAPVDISLVWRVEHRKKRSAPITVRRSSARGRERFECPPSRQFKTTPNANVFTYAVRLDQYNADVRSKSMSEPTYPNQGQSS